MLQTPLQLRMTVLILFLQFTDRVFLHFRFEIWGPCRAGVNVSCVAMFTQSDTRHSATMMTAYTVASTPAFCAWALKEALNQKQLKKFPLLFPAISGFDPPTSTSARRHLGGQFAPTGNQPNTLRGSCQEVCR